MAKCSYMSSFLTAFLVFLCFTTTAALPQLLTGSDSSPSPSPPPPLPLPLEEEQQRYQVLDVLWEGVVTATDSETEEVRWSFSLGAPLNSAHGLLLDVLESTNSSAGITGDPLIPEDEFIFCGTDWKLYSFDKHRGIQDLPISPDELVRSTPAILNGALILGTMSTSVFLLDAKSGKLVQTFDSKNDSFVADHVDNEDIWRFLEPSLQEFRNTEYLFVFRKDYTIKSVNMESGTLLWNVSVGDIKLHHINSNGIPRLPQAREGSSRDSSVGEAVPTLAALPASYETGNHFLPARVHASQDSPGDLPLGSRFTKKQVTVALFLTFGCCAAATFFFWNSEGKLNKEEKQVTRKKKGRRTKPGVAATPQESLQCTGGPVTTVERHTTSQSVAAVDTMTLPNEGNEEYYLVDDLRVTWKHIGSGSNGTMVFDGYMDKRSVAVKRMLRQYYDKAQKEIDHLIKSDEHPNIVRYFYVKFDAHFVYVVLERCRFSLNDLVLAQSFQHLGTYKSNAMPGDLTKEELEAIAEKVGDTKDYQLWDEWARPSAILLQFLRDILAGLSHLHDVGIVHRDLKPHNVLISSGRMPQAKLSDMGISKQLADGVTSLDTQSTGSGSSGWQAPEQLMRRSQTRSVDLFSLGCVLFFSISGGYHPFGTRIERDMNIIHGKLDLFRVEHVPEAMDLIPKLLHHDPKKRPNVNAVRVHPLFWRCDVRLKFLCDASDRVELEDKECQSLLLEDLEAASPLALDRPWGEKLDAAFIQNLGKYRKYNYSSVRDLLRVIRNKSSHFRELPPEIQQLFEPFPEGFETYFRIRFPRLLLEVFKVVHKHCRNEELFKRYFHTLVNTLPES